MGLAIGGMAGMAGLKGIASLAGVGIIKGIGGLILKKLLHSYVTSCHIISLELNVLTNTSFNT